MIEWIKGRHPGDAVRIQYFVWESTGELGDVRIMDYGEGMKHRFRVACFCPGRDVCLPGDTPKVEPESDYWTNSVSEANGWFDLYCSRERADGWTDRAVTSRLCVAGIELLRKRK